MGAYIYASSERKYTLPLSGPEEGGKEVQFALPSALEDTRVQTDPGDRDQGCDDSPARQRSFVPRERPAHKRHSSDRDEESSLGKGPPK